MAAPTPLSAFTDGIHDAAYAILWAAGALLPLLPIGLWLLICYLERDLLQRVWTVWRRSITSRRLHRAARRSGR